jgi:uncharacterized protein YbaA (DUF1428 family)
MTYVDGFVLRVPANKIEAYRKIAEQACKIWKEHGALDYKECVLEDLEDKGFCKTFPNSFGSKEGETIVFAYITYKSRAHRDEVNAKVHTDKRMSEMCNPDDMPFDCKNMAYGGFQTIVE